MGEELLDSNLTTMILEKPCIKHHINECRHVRYEYNVSTRMLHGPNRKLSDSDSGRIILCYLSGPAICVLAKILRTN